MSDHVSDAAEQIPNQHIITELQTQLNNRTAELVMANARIRTRGEQIRALEEYVTKLLGEKAGLLEDKYGPAV